MKFVATVPDAGLRLDVWLARVSSGLSRARVQGLLKAGHIAAAGRILHASTTVTPGLVVEVTVPPPVKPESLTAESIPLNVLHEDADIMVLDKPPGLVVHPAAGHATGTMVNAILHHCPNLPGIGGERRPGIVHRLDKDTSGVMVVAKSQRAIDDLVRQFQSRDVRKEYVAIVFGHPHHAERRIETLIGRSTHDRKKMSALPASGRPAISHYRVEEILGEFSLVRVRIETGRTHQIRVHMAHIGHPVLGDASYGGRRSRANIPVPVSRQMLHAAILTFTHPVSRERLTFTAPLPPDMESALAALRIQAGHPSMST
jgi:23S rRNA pseudouridine1911/1915/1917 synthase